MEQQIDEGLSTGRHHPRRFSRRRPMSEVIELESARKNRLAAEHRASFGSWEDWSADEIMYLLRQLRDGHWENCGEPMEGFAIAVGGLSMAIDANEDEGEGAVRGVLTVFGRHRLH